MVNFRVMSGKKKYLVMWKFIEKTDRRGPPAVGGWFPSCISLQLGERIGNFVPFSEWNGEWGRMGVGPRYLINIYGLSLKKIGVFSS